MFARINQLARHLTRPLPNYAHSSAFSGAIRPGIKSPTSSFMAATAMENHKKMIHTAGCIIIGDEVLGGKVGLV